MLKFWRQDSIENLASRILSYACGIEDGDADVADGTRIFLVATIPASRIHMPERHMAGVADCG